MKILIGLFILPWIILGHTIGVVRYLLSMTFGLAWTTGKTVFNDLILASDKYMKRNP